jgi:hypothetical protein
VEASAELLHPEKGFYAAEAPLLHQAIAFGLKTGTSELISYAQQASLRLVRIVGDGHSAALSLCEARLHQATDYQVFLHREAMERARVAAAVWSGMPAAMVREELAHAQSSWSVRQQGLRAEALAAAAMMHGALVELKLGHDDEGVVRRERQQRNDETLRAILGDFVTWMHAETARAQRRGQRHRAQRRHAPTRRRETRPSSPHADARPRRRMLRRRRAARPRRGAPRGRKRPG